MNNFVIPRPISYSREEASRDAKKIYIFCEGKKEQSYFRFFQELSSNLNIISIKTKDDKSAPALLVKDAKEKLHNGELCLERELNDEVWFVVDTDEWRDDGQLQTLKNFIQNQNKDGNAWHVAISNRSFEIWHYYHLVSSKPNLTEWNSSEQTFKQFIASEIKSRSKSKNNGFHKKDIPLGFKQAIQNAQKHFECDEEGYPKLFSTEVYCLANVILPFVEDKLKYKD